MPKLIIGVVSFLFSIQIYAEGPCAQDREKFCAGVEKGEGRIMKCMKENKEKLSSACQAEMKEKNEKRKKNKKEKDSKDE